MVAWVPSELGWQRNGEQKTKRFNGVKMNSLIKYGLYFVVAFSVLAFGAAEVWAFSIVEFVVFLLVFLCFAGKLMVREQACRSDLGREREWGT